MSDEPGEWNNTDRSKWQPTYVLAEAETTPLPRIKVEEPPQPAPQPDPRSSKRTRIGDLPMRVIYRLVAGGVAVVAVVGVAFFLINRPSADDKVAAAPLGNRALPSPSAGSVPPSPTDAPPQATPVPLAAGVPSPGTSVTLTPIATVTLPPGSAGGLGPTPTPTVTPAKPPGVEKLPPPPAKKRLGALPGKATKAKGRITDRRTGISYAKLVSPWGTAPPSPFAHKRFLKGTLRDKAPAWIASAPMPLEPQKNLRLAAADIARWTLRFHPKGTTVSWRASQELKAGKRKGWLLVFTAKYTVKGKSRESVSAVGLVNVGKKRPAMIFMSIPDTHRRHWRDITTVISSLKSLR
ncbi:hypothetical protein [Rhizohabitans arisaemae]|uniref:hypothetical protein n=1 Tax=Rhizohabitans arisaemae TaxID=2720610 RepID=UPI0024B09548|nr:hypothetical protein [Rhizohabitans arisaemae]